MRVFLSFLAISISAVSCEYFENEQNIPDNFTGEWSWERTIFQGHPIEADSVDYDMRLMVFNHNEAEWYRDDPLMSRHLIKFEETGQGERFVMYGRKDISNCGFVMSVDEETEELSLTNYNCRDLSSYYFQRTTAE